MATTPLETVQDYITAARILLQDTVPSPYRYADSDLLLYLNEAFPEAKKARPDLFLSGTIPYFTTVDTTTVVWDQMYRVPIVYYMVGKAQMRDGEEQTDSRSAAFLGLFIQKLGSIA
jgi:hypothetical protein